MEILAEELRRSDCLTTRIITPCDQPPFLRVVHLDAGQLAEDVRTDGANYLWSWGEPIAPLNAPDFAAAEVARVLTPQGR
ncbi:hypothetical protein [Actinomadura rupiterrae]|uniref:hypothetical protein n=1 Tax=Actinomadura rupiterrae TaxID=559627 RepID=UPI0020A2AA98|nr:hypothetical protein [Actinomadura rupiterrae]MCP2342954.1 hypothetical protein [Actinomadura rupiterrae]